MNPSRRLRRGRLASPRGRRRSGHRSPSYKALLTFMLSAVGVALQGPNPVIPRSPTSATPETRLPSTAADHHSIVIAYSLLFCFSASLSSVALGAHDKYRRASRLLLLLGFHSILLTLASLLSTILPRKLWLIPYILFAVFVVCSFLALFKRLYLRVWEVGAFRFFIRRFALARETPPSPGWENV